MPNVRTFAAAVSSLSIVLIASGCGDGVDTAPISGNVTYQGQPLANGSVTFYPEAVQAQPISVGIGPNGVYAAELSPGEYVVTIHAPGIQVPEGWKEGDPPPPPPKLVLPPKYSERARTELRLTVVADDGSESHDFNLN